MVWNWDAACATSIMNQSVHFSLKIIDDKQPVQIIPGDPGNVAQIFAMLDLAQLNAGWRSSAQLDPSQT